MTRSIYEDRDDRRQTRNEFGTRQLFRRPAPRGAGNAVYAIEVFEADVTVLTGDNRFEWMVPEHLDGAVLVQIEGYLTVASSSGSVQVQIHNETAAVDMLSTVLSIDPSELDTTTAATPAVINTANDQVSHGDHLRVDIDNAGTGAKGLGLILTFIPNDAYALAITGQQGPPGGVASWTGAWTTATGYTTGQSVSHNGTSYVARSDHTSGASSEPGVGASWETYWQVLEGGHQFTTINFSIDGNGYVLTTGVKAYVHIPFACTLTEVVMLASPSGSVVVDVWKDSYTNALPTDADSITASSPPTISGGSKSKDAVLSGWTTAIAADDVLVFNIDSCSTINKLTLALKAQR